jgi:hypothetical protein
MIELSFEDWKRVSNRMEESDYSVIDVITSSAKEVVLYFNDRAGEVAFEAKFTERGEEDDV